MDLEKFRELVGAGREDGAADDRQGFPPNELRFVLEFPNPADLETERDRVSGFFPLHAFRLQRLSPHSSTDCFLVLRFPEFERVFRQDDLFKLSYQLADLLNLVSVEPDLGTDFFTEPETGEVPTHEDAFLRAFCQVSNDPPADTAWALSMIEAQRAWTISTGEGIRIGHADTGYSNHTELADVLELGSAVDLIDSAGHGADPLRPGAANPGHGTATGSVIASRCDGRIAGVAPAATLVPIRCIEDVKVFNQAPVAAAIAYAQSKDCQIISMSLGGVPSRALYAAIASAVDNNIIVLAAAGNCVTTVVWPARYDEVIAVAGCNYLEHPWKGSCQGNAVDITAPAEHVWCARRESVQDALDAIKAGQGTSYAVAMVAGAAALWLSAHGRDAVVQEAGRRGIPVQLLFKTALQVTARRPQHWDSEQFGAGILDVLALLQMPLNDIPLAIQREEVPDATRSVRRMLGNEHGTLPATARLDWRRYSCELATIALQTAKEGAALAELQRESKTPATLPSPQLADAIDGANEPALLKFGIKRNAGITLIRTMIPEPAVLPFERLKQALSVTANAGLESATRRFDPDAVQAYLRQGGVDEQITHFEKKLQHLDLSTYVRRHTIAAAEKGLAKAAKGDSLDTTAQFGIEALIALTGRPAIRTVEDGKVNLDDPRIEDWHDRLYLPVKNGNLNARLGSVGRIDLDGRHIGTGFVIAPGRILTNRHVLQDIGTPIPSRDAPNTWLFDAGEPTIDFADDPSLGQGKQRFLIKSVVAAGERYIEDSAFDFSLLDAAILEVETINLAGTALPAALKIWSRQGVPRRYTEIVAVGYPARLARLPRTPSGTVDDAGLARLDELYKDYNVRYIAPGEITVSQDGQRGSPDFWTMRYDATTLGGCSGSCVLQLDNETGVVGLHFGGTWRAENFGHALGTVKAYHPLFNSVNGISWIV